MGHYFNKNCTYLVSLCSINKLTIRLWMDGFNLNVILIVLSIWFCHTAPIASTWQSVPEPINDVTSTWLSCFATCDWLELPCNCIVTSWSQRRRPKHGGLLVDRWGSTCHAYGRKFAIKYNVDEMKICKFSHIVICRSVLSCWLDIVSINNNFDIQYACDWIYVYSNVFVP